MVQEPWSCDILEISRRWRIDQGPYIGVLLEQRRGKPLGRRPFERLCDHLGFMLSEGQEQNASSFQNAA